MAENLGASFKIDITQLQAGLKTANRLIRESESQFKAAAAGMDDWGNSEEGLRARISSLNKITDTQREKVRALKDAYQKELANGLDEASDRAVMLRTQINNEEAALRKNEAELKKNTEALKNLGEEAEDTGDKIEKSGSAWEKFGGAAKAAGAIAATAIAAIGAGVLALTKQAVESYAEYEQLIGGVETLFGAGGQSIEEYAKSVGKSVSEVEGEYNKLISAQDTLIENANNAYKTAGMSANEYMSNVTSFSASLIASLDGDTQKAAAAADRAMTDISDNANKMGTDMQSIVDTYQSLARGNYQMLDNLKLGYGGTKSEMERMIADANKVKAANGEMANLSIDSFADVTEAIHIIQNEMGITGTTAKEASSTISGSVGAMKAAWDNLLTGIADDTQDFDALVNNFVDSLVSAAENILPRISTALGGIIKLVEKLIPQLPPIIQQFLPVIVDGIMKVTKGIVKVLPTVVKSIMSIVPQLVTAIINMLPELLNAAITVILELINALTQMLPTIVDAIMQVLPMLINSLIEAIPQLLEAAIQLLMAIIDAIPTIIDALLAALPSIIDTIVNMLIDNLPTIIDASVQLFMGIIKAIPQILTSIAKNMPQIIKSIVTGLLEGIPELIKAGGELLAGLFKGMLNPQAIWDAVKSLFNGIVGGIKSLFGIASPSKVMKDLIGKNLALGIGVGFDENIDDVNKKISDALTFDTPQINVHRNVETGFIANGASGGTKNITVNQYNTYSQAHSRYELYKSKQQTAAAVRLAVGTA